MTSWLPATRSNQSVSHIASGWFQCLSRPFSKAIEWTRLALVHSMAWPYRSQLFKWHTVPYQRGTDAATGSRTHTHTWSLCWAAEDLKSSFQSPQWAHTKWVSTLAHGPSRRWRQRSKTMKRLGKQHQAWLQSALVLQRQIVVCLPYLQTGLFLGFVVEFVGHVSIVVTNAFAHGYGDGLAFLKCPVDFRMLLGAYDRYGGAFVTLRQRE